MTFTSALAPGLHRGEFRLLTLLDQQGQTHLAVFEMGSHHPSLYRDNPERQLAMQNSYIGDTSPSLRDATYPLSFCA